MKKSLIIFLILLFAWSCEQIEPDLTGIGEVKFQSVLVDSFSGNLPNGRIAGPSTWKHVFKNTAVMEIKNKVTGQEYKFDYNPNEFGEGIKFPLPYGSYTYKTKVSGGAFEKFLPFRAEGEFNLGVASLEVSIQATTDYGLITVKNEFVKSIGIRYGSELCDFKLLPDQSFYFIYARKEQVARVEITESLTDKLIKRDVPIAAYNHYNFFLKKAEMNGMVNFIELAFGVFEYVEEEIQIGESESETFTDPRDGQVYKIVKIGDQTWFAENLNYGVEGSWCYDNNPEKCNVYGRLYDWNTAKTACPGGWHLPTEQEWRYLANFLGDPFVAGGKLKSITGWNPPNTGASNESGFSAIAAGARRPVGQNSVFEYAGIYTWFWSSTLSDLGDNQSIASILYYSDQVLNFLPISRKNGNSCRCVKD